MKPIYEVAKTLDIDPALVEARKNLGIVLVQAVRPGTKVIVNSFDLPQNMRSGAPAFGAIGISLFQAAWNQIWRRLYGIPTMNGGVGPAYFGWVSPCHGCLEDAALCSSLSVWVSCRRSGISRPTS